MTPLATWESHAESYPSLRRAIAERIRPVRRAAVREPTAITERIIQCVWYDGHFQTQNLRLADGRSLEIKSPGRWNSEKGPDFRKADLVIDGQPVKGDIEIHLNASGWSGHGHAGDPEYRDVVLHVVLDASDGKTSDRDVSGREIPRLVLRPLLHGDLDTLSQIISADDYPYESPAMVGRCHKILSRLDHDDQVTAFYEAAAARRIRGKIDRFASQVRNGDFDQVFYQALLTAMGHRGSKTLLFLLAKRVPVAELRSLIQPWKGNARALAAQSVLLNVANLVNPLTDEEASRDKEIIEHIDSLNRVWAELGGHFTDRVIPPTPQWHRGMRPASFPERRIAGVANLVIGERGLFANLLDRCRDFADAKPDDKQIQKQIKELVGLIAVDSPNDHMAWRHTIAGKRLASAQRLIGESQAKSVVFNALLPLLALWAKREKERALREWANAALLAFPALSENTVTRFMKYRLFGLPDPPKSLFKTEMRQQALFHVFTDCCDHTTTSCEQCAFFARLRG